MDNKRHRPLNINPLSVQLPLPAFISISHRLSGIFIFLGIPFILWALSLSLESQSSFESLQNKMNHPFVLGTVWFFLAALVFHLLAGLRHLMMDLDIGASLTGGRFSAWIVLILFFITMSVLTAYLGGLL